MSQRTNLENERQQMRAFYVEQYYQLQTQLAVVTQALANLGGPVPLGGEASSPPASSYSSVPASAVKRRPGRPRQNPVPSNVLQAAAPSMAASGGAGAVEITMEDAKAKRSYKKKRGPKAVWPKRILKRLRQTDTPMSYDQLASHYYFNDNDKNLSLERVRQGIVSSAFKMRKQDNKLDTWAKKGSRTVYVGLPSWFDDKGVMLKEYQKKIKADN